MKNTCLMALALFGVTALADAAEAGKSALVFDAQADMALQVMTQRAEELNVTGVARSTYMQGDTVTGWSLKIVVVGKLKNTTNEVP